MVESREIENIINAFKKDYKNGRCRIIPREKNQDTLNRLQWIEEEALYYLEKNLKVEHYLSGPEQPHIKRGRLQTGSVWKFLMLVFSPKAKIKLEAYVKFHYCKDGTIFISFHESI